MGSLFKYVLWSSPVLAIIIYLVFTGHQKIDTQMMKQDLIHERDKAEMSESFASSGEERKMYKERAAKANQDLAELEKQEKGQTQDQAKVKSEMDKAIKDFANTKDQQK